jgi:hypothetical protein
MIAMVAGSENVSRGPIPIALARARFEASEAHRILLESPFDAAAVVVAARQAASNRRLAFRRARQPLREAG